MSHLDHRTKIFVYDDFEFLVSDEDWQVLEELAKLAPPQPSVTPIPRPVFAEKPSASATMWAEYRRVYNALVKEAWDAWRLLDDEHARAMLDLVRSVGEELKPPPGPSPGEWINGLFGSCRFVRG